MEKHNFSFNNTAAISAGSSVIERFMKDFVPCVMLSSTVLDLPRHRTAVQDACLEAKMLPLRMEREPANGKHRVHASMEMVDGAHIYIGVIGNRYGKPPKGYSKSITEMEYDRAVAKGIDRRMFLVDGHQQTRNSVGEDDSAMLAAFRDRLLEEATPRFFVSVPDLKEKVLSALLNYWLDLFARPEVSLTKSSADAKQFNDEQRNLLKRLLVNATPENSCRAAIMIAKRADSVPVKQILQSLTKLDWRRVLQCLGSQNVGEQTPADVYMGSVATAISTLHAALEPADWQKVRSRIASALVETRLPWDSESYTLFLRALTLINPEAARDLVTTDSIFVDKLSDRRRTVVARRELKSLLAPVSASGLRVAFDAWPGYFPVFAMEDRLRAEAGITLFDIESSKEKIRLLRERRLDLIATTPGCVINRENRVPLDLRVVAILNQSVGGDQILIRGAKYQGNSIQPEQDELNSATWIVTAGSTSELFARAVCQKMGLKIPTERWQRMRHYHDALDVMSSSRGVVACSTWEPYSSWMRDQDPGISVLCSTSDFEPLVVDCLVTLKTSPRLEMDERVARLIELWDECLAKQLHLDKKNVLAICNRFVRFEPDDYYRMVAGVRYFRSTEMIEKAASGEFEALFARVLNVWDIDSEKKSVWKDLIHPASHWFRSPPPVNDKKRHHSA